LVPTLLLLLTAGVPSLPAVHWRVIGWWRGEAFYQDRPSSWWAREIQQSYSWSWPWGSPAADHARASGPIVWQRQSAPTLAEQLCRQINGGPSLNAMVEALMAEPPLLDGDEAALPVLRELLRHEDSKVRMLAVYGLGAIGKRAKPALPGLRAAIGGEDDNVRRQALRVLQRIEAADGRADEAVEE
jgi:hypothetical protein